MQRLWSSLILISVATAALAQAKVDHDLAFDGAVVTRMVGEWVGSGWQQMGQGERNEFQVHERVRWHLSGRALIVEGLGFASHPETGETIIGHDAMAVIRHDQTTGTWRFFAGRGGAGLTDHELEIVDPEAGVIRWSPKTPQGDVRFTITIADDTWHEIGEFSSDGGETWFTFLAMSLERTE